MSKDDSELISEAAAHAAASPLGRPSGLKGRLRRAFSFNAAGTLESGSGAGERTKDKPGQAPVADPDAPGAPPKRSRAASLFNPRFNRSTDNISLSSTVSSASVMIRKIGNMGKLARRNTLSGITSIFKDKKDGEEEEGALCDVAPTVLDILGLPKPEGEHQTWHSTSYDASGCTDFFFRRDDRSLAPGQIRLKQTLFHLTKVTTSIEYTATTCIENRRAM